jgi:hypothetical protein
MVRTFNGDEQLSHTHAYIASTSTFQASAQITLPNSETPENLLTIEAYPDRDGIHHIVAFFG